jgi:hypothetical protein
MMIIDAAFPAKSNVRIQRRVIAAAAIWFVVCLIWTAPASLFALLLKPIVPQLQLQNISGGFWHGAAGQAIWQQEGRAIALGSLQWKIYPLSLLWLHPSARLSATTGMETNQGEQFFDAHVRISPFGHIALRDANAAIPMTLLSQWLPLPANGTLTLKLDRAEFARKQLQSLQGTVYWQRAQWQWNSRWVGLGDYSCALQMPNAQQLQGMLQGQGALGGNGEVTVNFSERSYTLNAQLKAERSLPEEFRQGLVLMAGAQPGANGQMQIRRSGRW